VFKREGGTTFKLQTIRNETSGRELGFVYDMLDGEKLIIDVHPLRQTVTSSFFGSRPDVILPGSDQGEFSLLPGSNQVNLFIRHSGAPTITAYLLWRDGYWAVD